MSSLTVLLAFLLGPPAIGLLVGRWLAADDVVRSVQRHRQTLRTLGELTRTSGSR